MFLVNIEPRWNIFGRKISCVQRKHYFRRLHQSKSTISILMHIDWYREFLREVNETSYLALELMGIMQIIYLSGPLGSLGSYQVKLKIEFRWSRWRGRWQCCTNSLHYCTWTDSIKPNLIFSFLWGVPCFQRIFIQNLFWTKMAGKAQTNSFWSKFSNFPRDKRDSCLSMLKKDCFALRTTKTL